MSSPCDQFYAERDQRTHQYQEGWLPSERVLGVVSDARTLESEAGQILLLAFLDQAARTHRRIHVELPSAPIQLVVASRFAAGSLAETVRQALVAIDPCGNSSVVDRTSDDALTIGLGDARDGLAWYLGADGWIGELSRVPISVGPRATWGAAVASVIGASAAFRSLAGIPVGPIRLSAWNWMEGDDADAGPAAVPDPDVGAVLCVGSGAVGGSLTYWRAALGHRGAWEFVDGDIVKLHNTNRSVGYVPADAGWPSGTPANKATLAASLLVGTRAHECWYDEFSTSPHAVRQFDLILPLANERDVRAAIASLNEPLILHATTSKNWGAFLHRHIAGRDDCMNCRLRDIPVAVFDCSTGLIDVRSESDENSSDAALPFLSAAAGLMLASALMRLSAGVLEESTLNSWALDLRSAHRVSGAGRYRCRHDCRTLLPASIRRSLSGGRWTGLDPGRSDRLPRNDAAMPSTR